MHKMIMCVYSSLRPPVCLAGSCILAQRSSPQMNVPVRRIFLVWCRRPNRPPGQQEVSVCVGDSGGGGRSRAVIHVGLCVLYFAVFIPKLSLCAVAEEFDPEENLHSKEGQSHM